MPKTKEPDNLELMGALVEHHAAMAVADAVRQGKADLLAHANSILRDASLPTLATSRELKREIARLQRFGIIEKTDDAFGLTEEGAKALAILLYGRRWPEHVQPGRHRAAR